MDASPNPREKQDSGLIDLIAIDRDAKAAAAAAEKARASAPISETPPPYAIDLGSGDDVDMFAMRMQKPWQKFSRAKIAMAAGGVLLFLIGIAVATSGSSEPAKKAVATTQATTTPLPSSIPPPPPVETLTQAAAPAPVAAAPVPAKEPTVANVPAKHKAKSSARKAPRGKGGPKLMKVQSSGV